MPGVEIVRLAEAALPGADHDGHAHGPACAHGDSDPHVWLDPSWMAEQAVRVAEVLGRLDPEGAGGYAARAEALAAELEALDAELRGRMAPFAGRAFFINHPSLGHFAEAYGLRQRAVEEGGDAPGPRRLAGLVKEARASGVRAVFSQLQFEGSSVEVLAVALGVPVIEVNPLEEDYFRNLRALAAAMESAFGSL
jgi:zinc transport system substrate-binding protein